VRDPGALVRTLTILPEYLKTRERSQVIDYRDWSVPLGRRFRALKLWFVIRAYGVHEIRRMIAAHIVLASEVAGWIDAAPDFELVAPRRLALVNFRYRPRRISDATTLDRLNERLLEALNDSGEVYLTQNRVRGAYALRFSIGQTGTQRRHVEAAWKKITQTARTLSPEM
jgi:aromatic-L-amino-acid decarboxylase